MVPSDRKQKRGLPSSFQLDVPKSAIAQPIDLSEYLDDDPPAVVPLHRRIEAKEISRTESAQVLAFPMNPSHEPRNLTEPIAESPSKAEYHPVRRSPRKQFNMNPETLRMVDALLDQLCKQCVQKDVKASELFHSLVSMMFEARDHLDLSQVKPRGKWGTPTAKAFPISLKNAIRAAITQSKTPGEQ